MIPTSGITFLHKSTYIVTHIATCWLLWSFFKNWRCHWQWSTSWATRRCASFGSLRMVILGITCGAAPTIWRRSLLPDILLLRKVYSVQVFKLYHINLMERKIYYYRPQRSCGQGNIFTPVFHSVHRGGGGLPQCMLGYPPRTRQTPPDQADPPGSDTLPPGPGRPPRIRPPLFCQSPLFTAGRGSASVHAGIPPWDQADPTWTRQTPRIRPPPFLPKPSVHRGEGVCLNHAGIPPGTRQTPPRSDPLPRPGRPPPDQTPLDQADPPLRIRQPPPGSRLQHTVYERPVRILLECILGWF